MTPWSSGGPGDRSDGTGDAPHDRSGDPGDASRDRSGRGSDGEWGRLRDGDDGRAAERDDVWGIAADQTQPARTGDARTEDARLGDARTEDARTEDGWGTPSGWDRPRADEPGDDRMKTASSSDPGFPDRESLPPPRDPTGSSWWHVLTLGTGVAMVGFFLWPVLDPLLALTEPFDGTPVGTGGAFVTLAPLVLLVGVRFVLLPVALWRDATLLQETDVDWNPSRRFYMTAGAFWASLTCTYYLYKRCRHTGRPALPIPPERLYFEGRRVRSNWHLVVLVGAMAVPLLSAIDVLWDLLETIPYTETAGAVLAMVVVFVAAVGFLLLPIAYYRDTSAIRRADVDWDPSPALYVVLGYIFSVIVGAYYLYRRSKIDPL